MLTVQRCLKLIGKEFGIGALMLIVASGVCSAASTAVVSGIVRDRQGVAQMGAMVQVLASGPVTVATAFTDMSGRYRIANLVPGSYQVRATAAMFVPAMRRNLRLSTGMLATVNLTLNMLADPALWLPAQQRKPDEPGDDWTWTLRSAANRPILRMLGDGEVVTVSSGAPEGSRHAPALARVSVIGGDGGFGEGGLHTVVALDRKSESGSDFVVRTDAGAETASGNEPSAEVDAGCQQTAAFGGSSRLVVSFASHPEMMTGDDASGMQLMRMASARQMQLGDAVDVEAGATVYAIRTSGSGFASRPFLRVTVHPGEVWAVRYSLATSREVQSFDGLNSVATDLPATATTSSGRFYMESGLHQQFSVSRKAGGGLMEAAIYRDIIDRSGLTGSGMMNAAEMLAVGASNGAMVDTATGSFRMLGAGYRSSGMSVSYTEPVTQNLWASVAYERGAALTAENTSSEGLAQVAAGLHAEDAGAATAAVKGRVLRTGTKVRASYRWQPQHLVTAVDSYASPNGEGYMSFYVRQSVRWGDRLPPGLEATIDVTNLLAQGYRPFLSADGQTLFLAESPRTVRGGLSFTF
jgi:hypothetical protein